MNNNNRNLQLAIDLVLCALVVWMVGRLLAS